jgi:hypothetical protein
MKAVLHLFPGEILIEVFVIGNVFGSCWLDECVMNNPQHSENSQVHPSWQTGRKEQIGLRQTACKPVRNMWTRYVQNGISW